MNQYFQNIKVLLIGDFMVDHYFFCSSKRISPEAPVRVLKSYDELMVPGGAGNVALNMSKLGANVSCLGYIGSDFQAQEIKKLLNEQQINTENLYHISNITIKSIIMIISKFLE